MPPLECSLFSTAYSRNLNRAKTNCYSHKELRPNVVRPLYGLSIEIDYTWNCHTLYEPLDLKYVNQKLLLYHHATVRPRGAATGQVVEHGRLVGCGPRGRNV